MFISCRYHLLFINDMFETSPTALYIYVCQSTCVDDHLQKALIDSNLLNKM